MSYLEELPFYNLSDSEFNGEFGCDRWNAIFEHSELSDYIRKINSGSILRELNFKYLTPEELNSSVSQNSVNLSVFHLNVRSLNSKHSLLCQLLSLIELKFDVIVLSEIWSVNIEFLTNILPGYTFHYDLPEDSKIGGIGLFIKNTFQQQEICQFKINSTSSNRVENKWLEIQAGQKKYIIGGIYRHPNQSIRDFMSNLEHVLNAISDQKLPCIIAGDINIDLTKCNTSNDTAAYVDCLFMHNCQPTVLMPTRITSKSATLIDHIYYYEGFNKHDSSTVMSGNLITDISDHLPNYTLIIDSSKQKDKSRPLVRIFSDQNKKAFLSNLQLFDWNSVYAADDADTAYNSFFVAITSAFDKSFKLTRLSRKRSKDKNGSQVH